MPAFPFGAAKEKESGKGKVRENRKKKGKVDEIKERTLSECYPSLFLLLFHFHLSFFPSFSHYISLAQAGNGKRARKKKDGKEKERKEG